MVVEQGVLQYWMIKTLSSTRKTCNDQLRIWKVCVYFSSAQAHWSVSSQKRFVEIQACFIQYVCAEERYILFKSVADHCKSFKSFKSSKSSNTETPLVVEITWFQWYLWLFIMIIKRKFKRQNACFVFIFCTWALALTGMVMAKQAIRFLTDFKTGTASMTTINAVFSWTVFDHIIVANVFAATRVGSFLLAKVAFLIIRRVKRMKNNNG